jgi:hypothetical protein
MIDEAVVVRDRLRAPIGAGHRRGVSLPARTNAHFLRRPTFSGPCLRLNVLPSRYFGSHLLSKVVIISASNGRFFEEFYIEDVSGRPNYACKAVESDSRKILFACKDKQFPASMAKSIVAHGKAGRSNGRRCDIQLRDQPGLS